MCRCRVLPRVGNPCCVTLCNKVCPEVLSGTISGLLSRAGPLQNIKACNSATGARWRNVRLGATVRLMPGPTQGQTATSVPGKQHHRPMHARNTPVMPCKARNTKPFIILPATASRTHCCNANRLGGHKCVTRRSVSLPLLQRQENLPHQPYARVNNSKQTALCRSAANNVTKVLSDSGHAQPPLKSTCVPVSPPLPTWLRDTQSG